MASTSPEGHKLRALKPIRARAIDLMHAGGGTPWEDRGSTGLLRAFVRTCRDGLIRPGRMLHAIRRPETSSDATGFCLGIGAAWLLSCLIHLSLLYLRIRGRDDIEIDGTLLRPRPQSWVSWSCWRRWCSASGAAGSFTGWWRPRT